MKFELINPSDRIYFESPSLLIAALSLAYFNPIYGAKEVGGDESVPSFIFGGLEDWFKNKFGCDLKETFRDNMKSVGEVLLTFKLDGERTSMNDICKYANEAGQTLLSSLTPQS